MNTDVNDAVLEEYEARGGAVLKSQLRRENERLQVELRQERAVRAEDTCAYCLAPLGPPSGIEEGATRAKAHALTCEKHPMREVVRQRDELLEALEQLLRETEASEGVPAATVPCEEGCQMCAAQIAARAAIAKAKAKQSTEG